MKRTLASRVGATWAPGLSALLAQLRLDGALLLLSLGIQLLIGLLFGHIYDIRIFMAAGHQVGGGQNPYLPEDLSVVFQNPAFQDITTFGYPPPWSLILGGIYALTYAWFPSFLLYNLAIKIPLIVANVGLAYLVSACLRRLGAQAGPARTAWAFMLLNPFLLYASAAWGQFDSIVALLGMASLLLLGDGRRLASAVLLALAVAFKPTAIPLFLIPFFFLGTKPLGRVMGFYAVLALSTFAFSVVPFFVFGWDPTPILENWNAHFVVGGGLSPLAALELVQGSYQLQGNWWFLGLLWLPALGLASMGLTNRRMDFKDLLMKSTALILVFLLTRAWLSEPNIILALPFVVILATIGEIPRPWLHAVWILPLLFGIANVSVPQLFFPGMPHIMETLLRQMEQVRTARLLAKVVIVIPWQLVGWSIVVRCLRRPARVPTNQPT